MRYLELNNILINHDPGANTKVKVSSALFKHYTTNYITTVMFVDLPSYILPIVSVAIAKCVPPGDQDVRTVQCDHVITQHGGGANEQVECTPIIAGGKNMRGAVSCSLSFSQQKMSVSFD